MKLEKFYSELRQILEIEDDLINEETALSLDSLRILMVILFIDEHFNRQVKATEFNNVTCIKDLIDIIGIGNFK
jgi:acyl carrier protein